MWQEIKSYFFNKRIKSDMAKVRRKVELINLNNAKEIGFVFDASDFSMITHVRDVQQKLRDQGKKVAVFGYFNNDDLKNEPNLITNKDLNWYGYPVKKSITEFTNKEFDVIFGFFNQLESPLNVIFANSKSKLRIGVNYSQEIDLFDILVDKNNKSKSIIQSLTDFMYNVNTK